MFDNAQNDQSQTDNNGVNPVNDLGAPPTDLSMNPSEMVAPSVVQPVLPPADDSNAQANDESTFTDDAPTDSPVDTPPVTTPDPAQAPSTSDASGVDELSDIKRQALEQLSPLVHKLEQSPEEKYRTLMMMIQASDNQSLLSEAYDAAQKIEDEKVKAEALLNIVNEINYFSQKG